MKLTIGIASYNQQDYLRDAIESALNQTVECEILVCNDGSTDKSLDIARSYHVKVINQVNKGLPSARNTLIMNMTGDYLLPLDADDILAPNAAELILKKIEETNADIVAPSFKLFGLGNTEVILGQPNLEDFKSANRIGYCSAIKKEALLAIGGYSPRMTWGFEDYHLWHNLLNRGYKLVTIPKILWLYRVKENSMITEANKHSDELLKQINKDFYDSP